RGLDMRLRRLMGVADQIVASRFSSIDLSNKANQISTWCVSLTAQTHHLAELWWYLEGNVHEINRLS
ncbi:hypothetical protein, partial [Enterovibrio nigricans]|uniref:hypothetical protein n=1 Tax=Enterovibrio nigricans TaxID=504469 RepID=UPI001BB09537